MKINKDRLEAYAKHLQDAVEELINTSEEKVSHEEQLQRGGEIAALVGQTVLIEKLLTGEFDEDTRFRLN